MASTTGYTSWTGGTWGDSAQMYADYTQSGRSITFTKLHGRRTGTYTTTGNATGYLYITNESGTVLKNYGHGSDTFTCNFPANSNWSTSYWLYDGLGTEYTYAVPDTVGTVHVYFKFNSCDNDTINDNKPTFYLGYISIGKATWRINFNANGGSVSPTYKDIYAGNSVATPSATRTNASKILNVNVNGGTVVSGGTTRTSSASYTANGWYTTSGGGTKRCGNGGSYTPSAAETVYQHWSLGSYGNVTLPTTAQFVKENYTLLGFSSSSSATVATWSPGASVAVSNNGDTVYAVWKRNQSQIKIKTSANTWKNGLVYIKTNNGWKQVLHSYVKTNNGWKENNES